MDVIEGAGVLLLIAVCIGLAAFGFVVATTNDRYPPVVGFGALAITAVAVFFLAEQFMKVLPGLFWLAALKSLLACLMGYTLNDKLPVSRPGALIVAILAASNGFVLVTLAGRRLNTVEKSAIAGTLLVLVAGFLNDRYFAQFLGGVLVGLGGIWAYRRSQQR